MVRMLVMLITNILSNEPRSLALTDYERLLYGLTLSYLITYLIYI